MNRIEEHFVASFLVRIYIKGLIKIPKSFAYLNEFIEILAEIIAKTPEIQNHINPIKLLLMPSSFSGYDSFKSGLMKTINKPGFNNYLEDQEYYYLNIDEDIVEYIINTKNTILGTLNDFMDDICNKFIDKINESSLSYICYSEGEPVKEAIQLLKRENKTYQKKCS